MPEYVWDEAKNELLRRERGISFDDVKYRLTPQDVLDDIRTPTRISIQASACTLFA